MKKIMFNDKYGLTNAVLQGRKTMTRRLVGSRMEEYKIKAYFKGYTEVAWKASPYKTGEVVAVAQCYENAVLDVGEEKWNKIHKWYNINYLCHEKGLHNKMFVRADLMPHQIKITDIKVERLQDISEEDCLKEGIQECFPYIDRDPNDKVRTFQYFKDGKIRHRISPASECFAHLIDDVSGKGTWESNPFVFAYTFELIK